MEEVNHEAVHYFETLLNRKSEDHAGEREHFLNHIPSLITEEDNKELFKPISIVEVQKATFQLGADKAPGPDGFPARFYQVFWDIIGGDLHKAVEESRRRMAMIGTLNHTFITMIPKKKEAAKISDYRPIALCNTAYKIVTKIIANRLKSVLKKIISDEQSGFSPGCSIVEGIIIAHEAIHSARKTRSPSMVIKLDILKAYDLVDR